MSQGAPPAKLPRSFGQRGKYRVLTSLGSGGFAQVYLTVARGPVGVNKLVAVKQLKPELALDMSFLLMFVDEARLAARLSHPNVVQTYEVVEDARDCFIAMEYLEGQPLNRVLAEATERGRRLDTRLSCRMVSDALSGLHYAHELTDFDGTPLGVIHRDVSPHNLFVTYDGQVKVMDFGLAKAASNLARTEGGIIKGKLTYMAPEHLRGLTLDARADVFSMGVVLWELLAQRRMRASVDDPLQCASEESPSLASVRPDLDPSLLDIVSMALASDKRDRFQSALEMRDALEAYLAASGPPLRPDDVGAPLQEIFFEQRGELKAIVTARLQRVLKDAAESGDEEGVLARAVARSVRVSAPAREWADSRSDGPPRVAPVPSSAPPPPPGPARAASPASVPPPSPAPASLPPGAPASLPPGAPASLPPAASSPARPPRSRLLGVALAGGAVGVLLLLGVGVAVLVGPRLRASVPAVASSASPPASSSSSVSPPASSSSSASPPASSSSSASPADTRPRPAVPDGGAAACPADMVPIAAGTFAMGDARRGAPESVPPAQPVHDVTLRAFCIDRREVTVAAYAACSACGAPPTANDWAGLRQVDRRLFDPLCTARSPADHAQHPINCVSWSQARAFCASVGKRLPTEAEWERAARAAEGQPYPWGEAAPAATHVNACDATCLAWKKKHLSDLITNYGGDLPRLTPLFAGSDGFPGTAPVGTFPEGRALSGADDLAGNVAEWVGDWAGPYPSAPQVDPAGAPAGSHRVVRGGSFLTSRAGALGVAVRAEESPAKRSASLGFRCARPL